MKTTYRVDGKRISKKALEAKVGAEEVSRMTREAWEATMEEPGVENDFMTRLGMLNIEFQP